MAQVLVIEKVKLTEDIFKKKTIKNQILKQAIFNTLADTSLTDHNRKIQSSYN